MFETVDKKIPTLDWLERQQLLWRQRQIVTASWLNLLTERAALLQDVSNRLAELEKTFGPRRARQPKLPTRPSRSCGRSTKPWRLLRRSTS